MSNTQLTQMNGYDVSRMVFSDPVPCTIPNSTLQYMRVNITTVNDDGTTGDLVVPTGRLYSFGVKENKPFGDTPDTPKEPQGWQMAFCLFSREGATKEEKEWVDNFNKICDQCKTHLIDNREDIGRYNLKEDQLDGFNPLYYKKEIVVNPETGRKEQRNVEGVGPTLQVKLIYSKKNKRFVSDFYDPQGNTVDPVTVKEFCYATAALKFEYIYVNTKTISLQIKLMECEVEPPSSGSRRLLRASKKMLTKPTVNSSVLPQKDDEDNSDPYQEPSSEEGSEFGLDDSLSGPDEEEVPVVAKVEQKPKRVVKRVVKPK